MKACSNAIVTCISSISTVILSVHLTKRLQRKFSHANLKSKYYGSVGRSDVGQSARRAGINGWDDPDLSNWWANTGFKLDPVDRNLGTDDLIRKYMSSYLKALKNKSSKAYKLFVNKDNQWNMRTAKHDKTFMRNFSKWRQNQGL